MTYVIVETCEKDFECVKVCPVDCIHPKEDEADISKVSQLFVDPETCIDCGACVPVCPVESIFPAEELPAKFAAFTQRNADYYAKR